MTGVAAYDYDNSDITNDVTVEGSVNSNLEGTYTLVYKVTGANLNEVTATRVVTVEPEPKADATLQGRDLTTTLGNTVDLMRYVTAVDYDGSDIKTNVTYESNVDFDTLGTYTVTYKVTGANGNEVTKTFSIQVNPNKPRIKVPYSQFTINQGEEMDLLICITATSDIDGDITNKIVIKSTGGFNKDVPGTYKITYEVKDSTGLIGTNIRTITVLPN